MSGAGGGPGASVELLVAPTAASVAEPASLILDEPRASCDHRDPVLHESGLAGPRLREEPRRRQKSARCSVSATGSKTLTSAALRISRELAAAKQLEAAEEAR